MITPEIKKQLDDQILAMETKLRETKEDAQFTRGPLQDSLRVVVPMMEDQLDLSKKLLELLHNTG